jgi:hypothetical protein
VALWRTGALALAALAMSACGGQTAAPSGSTSSPQRPQLKPVSQSPLRVAGSGFLPGEQVHLVANGPESHAKDTRADSSGRFTTSFPRPSSCGSVTVTARGSQGSRAEFNLSQIACGSGS